LAAIPDQVVHELTLRGTMAEIRAHVQRYLDAGVDTACLYLLTMAQPNKHKRDVVMHAMRELAPGP
jgi:hypothetical protein